MNETIKVINGRVSLREYSSKKLKQEHIDIIINSALRAPTSRNMMLYSIIEVNDQKKKNKLGETCNHPWISKAPYILLFLADMQRWYDYYKLKDIKNYYNKRGEEFVKPALSNLMMSCCDALIAAQNSVIAAESLGIGSCYIGDIMGNCEAHKEMFNLPKWTFPITLVCYGYYPEDYKKKFTTRFDKKFICFEDSYRHLSRGDFKEMLADMEKRFLGIMEERKQNLAQLLYHSFTIAAPELEEKRSVRILIDEWLKRDDFT